MKSQIKNPREEKSGGRRRWRVDRGWESQIENAQRKVMGRGGWREERDLKSWIKRMGEWDGKRGVGRRRRIEIAD